jgi:hypothetical protein
MPKWVWYWVSNFNAGCVYCYSGRHEILPSRAPIQKKESIAPERLPDCIPVEPAPRLLAVDESIYRGCASRHQGGKLRQKDIAQPPTDGRVVSLDLNRERFGILVWEEMLIEFERVTPRLHSSPRPINVAIPQFRLRCTSWNNR